VRRLVELRILRMMLTRRALKTMLIVISEEAVTWEVMMTTTAALGVMKVGTCGVLNILH